MNKFEKTKLYDFIMDENCKQLTKKESISIVNQFKNELYLFTSKQENKILIFRKLLSIATEIRILSEKKCKCDIDSSLCNQSNRGRDGTN